MVRAWGPTTFQSKSKLKLKSNANLVGAPRAEVTIVEAVWSTRGTGAWWYGPTSPTTFSNPKANSNSNQMQTWWGHHGLMR